MNTLIDICRNAERIVKQTEVKERNTASVRFITDEIDVHEFHSCNLTLTMRASKLHKHFPELSAFDAIGTICGF